VPSKNFQERPEPLRAVNPLPIASQLPDRLVFHERSPSTGRKERRALLAIARVVITPLREPVVVGLVIVPQHKLAHRTVESPHVLVQQVVLVAATKIVERLSHVAFLLCCHILPQRAIVQRYLGRNWI